MPLEICYGNETQYLNEVTEGLINTIEKCE